MKLKKQTKKHDHEVFIFPSLCVFFYFLIDFYLISNDNKLQIDHNFCTFGSGDSTVSGNLIVHTMYTADVHEMI